MSTTDQKRINKPDHLNRTYIAPEIVTQRQRTLAALDIKTGEQILDIGCGTGFLTHEMALLVGEQGVVDAIDISQPMIDYTLKRCRTLPQVTASVGDVCNLSASDKRYDAVTCTQVLLYVENTSQALREMYRVLQPGGRIAVIETDWRGVVMSGNYPDLTEKIMRSWDRTAANPNLPPRIPHLLKQQGFVAIKTEAIPLLNTSFSTVSFSVNSLEWLCKYAYKQNMITREEGQKWITDHEQMGQEGSYFFCLNRFLFTAVKC